MNQKMKEALNEKLFSTTALYFKNDSRKKERHIENLCITAVKLGAVRKHRTTIY